jgi:hypothetical protein
MNEQSSISRRQAISGLSTGLVAVAVPQIFVAEEMSQPKSSFAGRLQEPGSKYPKPPFKAQSQPWPGLASKMDPRPDHGEESYKGSGRLMGRKALITGGDSGMGRATPRLHLPVKAPMWPLAISQQRSRMLRKSLR